MMTKREDVERILSTGDPDVVVREIRRIAETSGVDVKRTVIETVVCEYLLHESADIRSSSALALYALTQANFGGASVSENIKRASVDAATLERLFAAITVERDPRVQADMLWALMVQDYSDHLSAYAGLVAKTIEAMLWTPFPASQDTLERLVYGYNQLRTQLPSLRLRANIEPSKRELIGYAATGLPFVLEDLSQPHALLVYNFNLGIWLPPGGHFEPNVGELPDHALITKIRRETGTVCTPVWEARKFQRPMEVSVLPAPSFVLFEDLRGMQPSPVEIHAFHYDLNYICQVSPESVRKIGTGLLPTIRVPLGDLTATDMPAKREQVRERVLNAIPSNDQRRIDDSVLERILLSLDILQSNLAKRRRERLVDTVLAMIQLLKKGAARSPENLWTIEPTDIEPTAARTPERALSIAAVPLIKGNGK
jgi:hypothetical protein